MHKAGPRRTATAVAVERQIPDPVSPGPTAHAEVALAATHEELRAALGHGAATAHVLHFPCNHLRLAIYATGREAATLAVKNTSVEVDLGDAVLPRTKAIRRANHVLERPHFSGETGAAGVAVGVVGLQAVFEDPEILARGGPVACTLAAALPELGGVVDLYVPRADGLDGVVLAK